MQSIAGDSTYAIAQRFRRLRGDIEEAPDAAIVIPVNAQTDLDSAFRVAVDLAHYRGPYTFELILVVNNYEGKPPACLDEWRAMGIGIVPVPNAWRPGEVVCFSARVPGLRASSCDYGILFDADCKIPCVTDVLDWYVEQLQGGAGVAYTHVGHYDVKGRPSVWVRLGLHHAFRAFKRMVLRIPTARGSNYGVHIPTFLRLYDQDLLSDELNVAPTVKSAGGKVAYSGRRRLRVLTSGRRFNAGWAKILRYARYRIMYNLRMLPVRHKHNRYPYHERNVRT